MYLYARITKTFVTPLYNYADQFLKALYVIGFTPDEAPAEGAGEDSWKWSTSVGVAM